MKPICELVPEDQRDRIWSLASTLFLHGFGEAVKNLIGEWSYTSGRAVWVVEDDF